LDRGYKVRGIVMRTDEGRIEFLGILNFTTRLGVRFRGNRVGFTCFVHRSPFPPT
jgi:hypothetical protein